MAAESDPKPIVATANASADTKEDNKNDLRTILFSGKPLDDTIIYQIRQATKLIKDKDLDKIYVNCNKGLQQVLTLAKKHMENVTTGRVNNKGIGTIDTIQKLMRLVPRDEVFMRMFPKIILHEKQIKEKDGDFFISKDYKGMIKDDSKKNFIFQIILIIKNEYANLKPADNEKLWEIMTSILEDCITFRDKINDVI
jgi:hypothetical protein